MLQFDETIAAEDRDPPSVAATRPPGPPPPPLAAPRRAEEVAPPRRAAPRSSTRGALAAIACLVVAVAASVLFAMARDRPPPVLREVTVLDDWLCHGVRVPAVLRRATGEVIVYDKAAGRGRGLPVGVVAGAFGLQAALTDDGCPLLMAVRPTGPPIVLPIPPEGAR